MKWITSILTAMTLLVFLVSCSDEPSESSREEVQKQVKAESPEEKKDEEVEEGTEQSLKVEDQSTYEFTHNGQTFHVVSLLPEFLQYTTLAKEDTSLDRKDLYLENVLKPFGDYAEQFGADPGTGYFNYFSGRTNVSKLKMNTQKLIEKQGEIFATVEEALITSANKLPGKEKTVFVMPLNPDDYFVIHEMEGITGVAFSDDVFALELDPSGKMENLKSVVAHEYHHTVEDEMLEDNGHTLLERSIIEGKADTFARMVYPEVIQPWQDSTDSEVYYEFFNGKASKGIPLWTNYKVGYMIMQGYLEKNPNVAVEGWTKLTAKEILKESGF